MSDITSAGSAPRTENRMRVNVIAAINIAWVAVGSVLVAIDRKSVV